MVDQELRRHQLRALEAMKSLDKALTKYGISYFAIAGTALGAVRHKGFIPWDDDIDIVMTMPQYKKFVRIAPKIIKAPYTWHHISVNEKYETLSGGIRYGTDEPLITVFPLVKLSDNFLPKRIQWNIRKVMSPIWQRKVGFQVKQEYLDEGKNRKFAVWASSIIAAIIPKKTVLRILYRNEMRYEKKKVKWYCNIYSKYSLEKESIKAEWVKELIRVPFEDMELPIVKNYDAYLTHLYGDYMTPPAKEYQRPVHL